MEYSSLVQSVNANQHGVRSVHHLLILCYHLSEMNFGQHLHEFNSEFALHPNKKVPTKWKNGDFLSVLIYSPSSILYNKKNAKAANTTL